MQHNFSICYATENYWSTLDSTGKSWLLSISKTWSHQIPRVNCNKCRFPTLVSFINCIFKSKYIYTGPYIYILYSNICRDFKYLFYRHFSNKERNIYRTSDSNNVT